MGLKLIGGEQLQNRGGVNNYSVLAMTVVYKLHWDMIELHRYQFEDGRAPVTEWLNTLRDGRARAQVEIRLRRVAVGNFGDCKPVGEGVSELRIDVGAGYRVYFGRHGQTLIILLCGGDKSSQQADIAHAKEYWTNWKRSNS